MRSSVTSTFSGPDGFHMAMRNEGFLNFAITRSGRFRADLIQVTLNRLRLFAVKESLPRIACIKMPKDRILISFSLLDGSPQVLGGVKVDAETLVTLGPGTRVHARIEGNSHWGAIWFPIDDFVRYSQALTGKIPAIPDFVCRWRPPAIAIRLLHDILADTMRAAQVRPAVLTTSEAAHGLDQQIIHALIDCLSAEPIDDDIPVRRRRHALMDRFNRRIATDQLGEVRVTSISEALGVSDRFLRRCCEEHLGMSPLKYLNLLRLHSVHCALQSADPAMLRVSEAARRSGFRHLGRFAAEYRSLFSEAPSATLRQKPHPDAMRPRRTKHSSPSTPIEIDRC